MTAWQTTRKDIRNLKTYKLTNEPTDSRSLTLYPNWQTHVHLPCIRTDRLTFTYLVSELTVLVAAELWAGWIVPAVTQGTALSVQSVTVAAVQVTFKRPTLTIIWGVLLFLKYFRNIPEISLNNVLKNRTRSSKNRYSSWIVLINTLHNQGCRERPHSNFFSPLPNFTKLQNPRFVLIIYATWVI